MGNSIGATDINQESSDTKMTDEESELLKSLGMLQLLEEESGSSATQSSELNPPANEKSQLCNTHASTQLEQPLSTFRRIRHIIFPPKSEPSRLDTVSLNGIKKNELDQSDSASESGTSTDISLLSSTSTTSTADSDKPHEYNPILLGLGGAAFLLPHLAVLLSLPPVLRRRGAPYLPTFGGKLNAMFELIKNHAPKGNQTVGQLRFVDLGSGDGRVVFRAAREGLFSTSAGYEINPALHLFASCRRLATPRYWSSTRFYVRDLWKVPLREYDVVAVYGLSPIMGRLGKKLEKELRPGSIVVSNVFEIPGWRAGDRAGVGKGVYLYRVPECFGLREKNSDGGV